MGYYIQGPRKGKAGFLMENEGAVLLEEAPERVSQEYAVVCVVDNGPFEAAAYCYNDDELAAFVDPIDDRPKRWLKMDLLRAQELSGYVRKTVRKV